MIAAPFRSLITDCQSVNRLPIGKPIGNRLTEYVTDEPIMPPIATDYGTKQKKHDLQVSTNFAYLADNERVWRARR